MQQQQLNMRHLIIVTVLALAAGIWMGYSQDKNILVDTPQPIHGVILPYAKPLGEFQLKDNNNNAFNQASLLGQWNLLFIGYTSCPDICPTTLSTLSRVNRIMKQRALTPPEVIFISIDPERDTIKKLSEYVEYFNNDFIGVTGDIDELDILSRQLAVYFRKVPSINNDENTKDYLMEHSAALMLINPDGNLHAYLTAPHVDENIIQAILRSQEDYKSKQ